MGQMEYKLYIANNKIFEIRFKYESNNIIFCHMHRHFDSKYVVKL